jgi:O-antigen ligase
MSILTAQAQRSPDAPAAPARESRDAAFFLTLYAVLRIGLPSQYVIGPLGGAGQPAQLVGLGIALSWLADRLGQPWPGLRVRQPLKRFAFAFLIAVLASYLVAAIRPLASAEQLAADRFVLNVIAWTGVMLAAMDAITTRARLDTLLRRVTLLGGLEGVLGLAQLLAKQSFLQYFHLPGLADTGVDPLLLSRGSFLRPVGTAISPIEYGVFLSMVLPIALHYAVSDAGHRSFLARWLPVAAIAGALSLSLSRSAIISTVVAFSLLLPAWPPRLRRRVNLAVAAFVAVAAVALRGFVGTILGLFGGIGNDSSSLSRLDSYAVAWSFVTRSPVFGRGSGTFLPEYWILDDQFLGLLIEIGVVGLTCMLLLVVAGMVIAWRLPGPADWPDGHASARFRLGPVLAAALAAGCVSFAFFDAFSFPVVPSMVFLLLGCVGALQRLTREEAGKRGAGPGVAAVTGITAWSLAGTVRRLWPFAVLGIIATMTGAFLAARVPGVYYEQANVIFVAPNGSGFQPGESGLVSTAGVIKSQLGEQGPLPLSATATIVGAGIRRGVWVRLPNDGGQWATNFDREELDVEVAGGSATQVQAEMVATISRIGSLLRHDQVSAGVRPGQLIGTGVSPASPPVYYLRGSSSRAVITALALGLILTLAILVMADRRLRRSYRGGVGFGKVARAAGDSSARNARREAGRRARSS